MTQVGVLEFRGGNAVGPAERGRRARHRTVNVGDWIQSLAVRSLLERLVPRGDIVAVDRDTLPAHRGPAVRLLMNAVFFPGAFPLPPAIEPVFVGFQTSSRDLIRAHLDVFRRHEPIGCRDLATRDLLRERGVDAYVTGCLTMTLPRRQEAPATPRTFFVGGEGAGAIPRTLRRHVPRRVRRGSVYRYQREAVPALPLVDADVARVGRIAEGLLDAYRREATLVVTPLLHAAGPCLAMGIPVVLARKDDRDRFTAIDHLVPVYTPGWFHAIDWAPACPDLEDLKACLGSLVSDALEGKSPSAENRRFLATVYEGDATPTTALRTSVAPRPARGILRRLPLVGRWLRR